MTSESIKLELNEREARILREILKFSLDYCPVEGVSHELEIARDEVQRLVTKLEEKLKS